MATRLAQLIEENEELRRRLEELQRQFDEERARTVTLEKEVEKWKRGFNERRKRRTSRSERETKGTGKKPGRRSGHVGAQRAAPSRIDKEVHYPTPEQCTCGGHVAPTAETRSTIVQDIPPLQVTNVKHVANARS